MKKVKLFHVTPILINILLSIIFTNFLLNSNILEDIETPFLKDVTVKATIYNSMLFFSLIIIGSIILFMIVKMRKVNLLRLLFITSFLISFYGIIEIYGIAILITLNIPNNYLDIFQVIFMLISTLTTLMIFKMKKNILTTIITLVYGTAAGCLFGVIIPLWSIILISLLASLYDIYSVFYGPLKHLINLENPDNEVKAKSKDTLLKGVTVPFLGIHIGLGDIIFYSMLVSGTYIYMNLVEALIIGLGICIGAYITFKFLEKRRALPALPIPILFSLFLLLIMYYI